MKILVVSRAKAERSISTVPYIVISFSDHGSPLPEIPPGENLVGVLQLQFDDIEVSREGYVLFNTVMARKVARFVKSNLKKVQMIVVHCEMGISRSSGAAAAISRAIGLPYKKFMSDPYSPNRRVMKMVYAAMVG